ncbi:MAG: hypothetical protein ACO39X_07110, partial [Candidatus Nanopelagicaceae bacterium]
KLFSFGCAVLPAPPRYVSIPGVGAGIGFTRVCMVDVIGVGEGIGDGVVEGVAVGVGDGVGEGVGVGSTIAGRVTLFFFGLLQTNFPDFRTHSSFAPERVTVAPTFLHVAPLFIAAIEGSDVREVTTINVEIRIISALMPFLRAFDCLIPAWDMLPSCLNVDP